MASRMITLNDTLGSNSRCVLYVMSRDQRVRDNHALLAAQAEALEHELPLVVVFNLYSSLGNRRREHFAFMVEGLKEVEVGLADMGIPFVVTIGDMPTNVAELAAQHSPRSIYFDFSPLRRSRKSQKTLAARVACRVVVVDTHNVIPVWVTSDKEEFAAHTIRRKIHRLIDEWAHEPQALTAHPHQLPTPPAGVTWGEVDKLIASIPSCGIRHGFKSGEAAAHRALEQFIATGLADYAKTRNDPTKDGQSGLSPYLHFGQISALRILLDTMQSHDHPPQIFTSIKMPSHDDAPTTQDSIDSFVEELVVRKELSDNFCFYNDRYDSLDGARDWAKRTLQEHAGDEREFLYTRQQLESAKTHDEIWNAAQRQLTRTGKIHGYMRMYWAKKILEWTESPDIAVRWAIELNDTYHLDGGDPNGYVGVLWSIAGVHDRPWFNRSVFGTIRYMNASGLKKKFDTQSYVERWKA